MIQWSRIFTALAEDLGSGLSTYNAVVGYLTSRWYFETIFNNKINLESGVESTASWLELATEILEDAEYNREAQEKRR